MTNSTSAALQDFLTSHSFDSFTVLSLIGVAVLMIAVIEQEVLRAVQPAARGRNARVLGIVIYPFTILAIALIITRFVHLGS